MQRLRLTAPSDAALAAAVLGAAGTGLVALVLWQLGAVAALGAAAAAVGALLLLADARAAVLAALSLVVLCEGTADWGIPGLERAYVTVVGPLAPVDLLLLLAAAAVALHVLRDDVPLRLPMGFVAPLALLAFAFAVGTVNAVLGGDFQRFALISALQNALPLFVVPLLVVNVVRTREELRAAVGAAGVLAVVKAALGLLVVFAGLAAVEPGIGRLTYYESPGNLLVLLALMAALAAGLARVPLAWWLRWAVPLLALSLLLSFRRTFWLAAVVVTVVVYLVASGRTGRRLAVPGVLVLGVAGALVLTTGIAGGLQGPLADRAASLDPDRIRANDADRYRISERRNVAEQAARRPITGQGVGVQWRVEHPLPADKGSQRQYVHLAVLWHWFHTGLIGVIGYLWLMGAAVAAGVRVWRREPDRVLAAAGLAGGMAALALVVVELASSVVAVEYRGTVVFAAVVGLLSCARMLPSSAQGGPRVVDDILSA